MSKRKKTYVGKIAFCDNSALGITDVYGVPIKGGHYVYVRKVNGNKCDVNVITSLERTRRDSNGKPIKDKYGDNATDLTLPRIEKVKRGMLYPIPKNDANFSEWSAINLDGNIKDVKLSDLSNIGWKKIKPRHRFFVGKFAKK